VVFMDLNMPGQNGIETTAYLTQKWPDMKVLVLTVSEEAADLYNALKVGARGYVLKISSPQEIIDALRKVRQGWVVVSPAMAPRFLSELGEGVGAQVPGQAAEGAFPGGNAADFARARNPAACGPGILQRGDRRRVVGI